MYMSSLRVGMKCDQLDEWKRQTKEKLQSLERNDTCDVDSEPQGKDFITCNWVLNVKRDADGITAQYTATFLVCENRDIEELSNTLAPVLDFSINRLPCSISGQETWKAHQVEYRSAMFRSTHKSEVYMNKPSLMKEKYIGEVYRLKLTLYRLSESPQGWYGFLSKSLKRLRLKPKQTSACFFKGRYRLFLSFAHDLLIMRKGEIINKWKLKLTSKVLVDDMGEATDYLGMKIVHRLCIR